VNYKCLLIEIKLYKKREKKKMLLLLHKLEKNKHLESNSNRSLVLKAPFPLGSLQRLAPKKNQTLNSQIM
jgi:hypothetical protein